MAHIILSLTYQRKWGVEDAYVTVVTLHCVVVALPRFFLFWVAHCCNVNKLHLLSRWALAYTYLATTVIWGLILIVAYAISNPFESQSRNYRDYQGFYKVLIFTFFLSAGHDVFFCIILWAFGNEGERKKKEIEEAPPIVEMGEP